MRGRGQAAVGLVAVTLLLAGCGLPFAGPAPTFTPLPAPPALRVTVGGVEVPVVLGTYSWSWSENGQTGDLNVDAVPPQEALKGVAAPIVPPGAVVHLTFAMPPTAGTVRIERWVEGRLEPASIAADGSLALPTEPGLHLYVIQASWERGGGRYAFQVQVSAPSPSPAAAAVTASPAPTWPGLPATTSTPPPTPVPAITSTAVPSPATIPGQRIAFLGVRQLAGAPSSVDQWLMPLGGGEPTRLAESLGSVKAWSADGKRLFVVDDPGLYELDPATGVRRLLYATSVIPQVGSVYPAPDGRSVAFATGGCCQSEAHVLPTEGEAPLAFAGGADVLIGVLKGWDDKGRLVFAKDRELRAIDPRTGKGWDDWAKLYDLPTAADQSFVLSPDGRRIAQVIYTDRDDTLAVRRSDLLVFDLETGAARNLTQGFIFNVRDPSWSPDGEWIAFTASAAWEDASRPMPERDLWVMRSDGSARHNLTQGRYGSVEHPTVWAPTPPPVRAEPQPALVAFQRPDGLYYQDLDGPDRPRPLVVGLGERPVYLYHVSPSGRQVALNYSIYSSPLYVAEVGGQPRKVAESAGAFSWSPDGRWLAYQSFELANYNPSGVRSTGISVVRADGSAGRQVLPADQRDSLSGWTPDGKEVVFFRSSRAHSGCCGGKTEGDTYLVRATGGTPRLFVEGLQLMAWSPDGHQALMALPPGHDVPEIHLVGRDGKKQALVGVGGITTASPWVWLPDGSGFVLYSEGKVWLVDARDRSRRLIVEDVLPTPVLAADGAWLLFFRYPKQPNEPQANWRGLRVVGLDGRGERVVSDEAWEHGVEPFGVASGSSR